jgi:predicted nucleotidyltransferase
MPVKKLSRITLLVLLVAVVVVGSFLIGGCSSGSDIEFEVENAKTEQGKNLKPLRDEIMADVKHAVDIWINHPEKIEEVFTGSALNDFKAARALDKKEGVKRVRVHKNQEFSIADPNDGKRPQLNYKFLDMSYFVDAKTGKPKTKPYNIKRTITIFLVKEGGRYKIESMVGSPDAIR